MAYDYGVLLGQNGMPGGNNYISKDFAADINYRTLELGWNCYQPSRPIDANHMLEPSYSADVDKAMDRIVMSGSFIVLELGIHYAPDWVIDIAPLKNQYGDVLTSENLHNNGMELSANVYWNETVRKCMSDYITAVVKHLLSRPGANRIVAIRVGSGGCVETGYPGSYPGRAQCYWAFDYDAQTRSSCPCPGWKPHSGTGDPNAAPFYDWYVDRMVNTINLIYYIIHNTGFTGKVLQLMPGCGVHGNAPNGYTGLVRNNLMPAGPPWGTDGCGKAASYDTILAGLDRRAPNLAAMNVIVYCSSMADSSSVWPNDSRFSSTNDQDPNDTLSWSAARYISYLARKYRRPAPWGENPGPENYTDYVDMQVLFNDMKTWGYSTIFWAFDQTLHTPKTRNGRMDASLAQYKALIRANP